MANNCRKCGTSMVDEFVMLNLEDEQPDNMVASFNRSLEHIEFVHAFVDAGKANNRDQLEQLCLSCLKLVIEQLRSNLAGEDYDKEALTSKLKSLQNQKISSSNNQSTMENVRIYVINFFFLILFY
jgi:hypothetical protein